MFYFLFYTCFILGLVPVTILLLYRKKVNFQTPPIPFICLTALASLYEFVISYILKYNAGVWFQIYSLGVFITVIYFFYKAVKLKTYHLFNITMIGFVITFISSFIFWKKNDFLISTAINNTFITVTVIVYSLIWFKDKFDQLENHKSFVSADIFNLWDNSSFYVIIGLFIYYSTTLFLFLSSNLIFESELYFYNYWLVNIIATLFLRTMLIVAAWKMRKV